MTVSTGTEIEFSLASIPISYKPVATAKVYTFIKGCFSHFERFSLKKAITFQIWNTWGHNQINKYMANDGILALLLHVILMLWVIKWTGKKTKLACENCTTCNGHRAQGCLPGSCWERRDINYLLLIYWNWVQALYLHHLFSLIQQPYKVWTGLDNNLKKYTTLNFWCHYALGKRLK